MDTIRPLGINANRNSRLMKVTWNDGHISDYPFWLLRAACPCASCRGGHENMRSEPDPAVFTASQEENESNRMVRVEQVGGYAINFEWRDGHHYGIFTWHFLRELCPCPLCRAER